MKNDKLYHDILTEYGANAQLTVAVEELSELIKEVCKCKRGKSNILALAEEVADVEIILEQIKYIFEIDSDVELWKSHKLKRLEERFKSGRLDDEKFIPGVRTDLSETSNDAV